MLVLSYLDVVDPERRLCASGEAEFPAEDVKAIAIRHGAVLLQTWRRLTTWRQQRPTPFRCQK